MGKFGRLFCCNSKEQVQAEKKEKTAQELKMVQTQEEKANKLTMEMMLAEAHRNHEISDEVYEKLKRKSLDIPMGEENFVHKSTFANYCDKNIYHLSVSDLWELKEDATIVLPASMPLRDKILNIINAQIESAFFAIPLPDDQPKDALASSLRV